MTAKAKKRPEKKKKGERILLLPGAHGWEAWKGLNEEDLKLALRTTEHLALEVDGIPPGELTMAFPVRDVSALPFRAPTADDALHSDLADMHIERHGLRPLADAGVLTDFFRVGSRGEESVLLPVILAPPPEGHLPKRSPQTFDISARCLPLPESGVIVWKELDRWVFALSEAGRPLHFQSLAATQLGQPAGREIRLTLTQLQLQRLINRFPEECVVWVAEDEERPTDEELEGLHHGFGGSIGLAEKPAPVIPEKTSQLLPADVRAERVAVRQKQQTTIAVAVLVLLYLGAIGFAAYTLMGAQKKAKIARNKLMSIQGDLTKINQHEEKWAELRPIIEQDHFPVELLWHCANASPDDELKLERADIDNRLDEGGSIVRSIRLQGKAAKLDQVNTFQLNLRQSDALRDYRWNTPPASETNDGRWAFIYDGVYVEPNETQ